ncbi:hypothetical protein PF002_g20702 [Phytophthora fragariae]|uniref:Uncharacterized protein n=1 Tax=Phytophthora fragariae TaxID=53985 RepID=A0A6A3JT47_9STRA|nr:hypothetical protein PF003_g32416 [Phytophthora fragariae]KAE8995625.1 hypothetical protein PF011_g16242 [Phytophthora fragariae]KAE9198294.1 hypothetical protein PF004_g19577 [Phytophthora fragariae]KAE9204197.1 hypothetical protein PF002_g20702 [Phytophthora fragariae]
MGHADGLSRLHSDTICAFTIADLLNDDSPNPGEGPVPVEEGSSPGQNGESTATSSPTTDGVLSEAVRAAMDELNEDGRSLVPLPSAYSGPEPTNDASDALTDAVDDELPEAEVSQTASSCVDFFVLDRERFQEEQKRPPGYRRSFRSWRTVLSL